MADLVIVAVFLVFIAVCVAYVRWCDRLVGPDTEATDTAGSGRLGAR